MQRRVGDIEGFARSERMHFDIHAVIRGVLVVDAEGVIGIVRIHRDVAKDGVVLPRHGEVRRHRVGAGRKGSGFLLRAGLLRSIEGCHGLVEGILGGGQGLGGRVLRGKGCLRGGDGVFKLLRRG